VSLVEVVNERVAVLTAHTVTLLKATAQGGFLQDWYADVRKAFFFSFLSFFFFSFLFFSFL
jgi:hypothetical protein